MAGAKRAEDAEDLALQAAKEEQQRQQDLVARSSRLNYGPVRGVDPNWRPVWVPKPKRASAGASAEDSLASTDLTAPIAKAAPVSPARRAGSPNPLSVPLLDRTEGDLPADAVSVRVRDLERSLAQSAPSDAAAHLFAVKGTEKSKESVEIRPSSVVAATGTKAQQAVHKSNPSKTSQLTWHDIFDGLLILISLILFWALWPHSSSSEGQLTISSRRSGGRFGMPGTHKCMPLYTDFSVNGLQLGNVTNNFTYYSNMTAIGEAFNTSCYLTGITSDNITLDGEGNIETVYDSGVLVQTMNNASICCEGENLSSYDWSHYIVQDRQSNTLQCDTDYDPKFPIFTATPIPSVSPTTSETTSPTSSGTMGPTSSQTTSPASSQTMGPTSSETMGPTSSETMGPTSSQTMGPTSSETMGPTSSQTMGSTSSQTMNPTPPASASESSSALVSVSPTPSSSASECASNTPNGITPSPTPQPNCADIVCAADVSIEHSKATMSFNPFASLGLNCTRNGIAVGLDLILATFGFRYSTGDQNYIASGCGKFNTQQSGNPMVCVTGKQVSGVDALLMYDSFTAEIGPDVPAGINRTMACLFQCGNNSQWIDNCAVSIRDR